MVRFGHLPYLLAAVLSTQVSTTWNFAGMELFVFSGRKGGSFWGRYLRFCLLNNTVMLARLPFLALLVSIVHCPKTLANVLTLIAVFVVRFGISDRFIYEGGDKEMAQGTRSSSLVGPVKITVDDAAIRRSGTRTKAITPFRFNYDLHGIVSIGSDVVLPELAYFRVEPQGRGRPAARRRRSGSGRWVGPGRGPACSVRSDGRSIRWEEHFGPPLGQLCHRLRRARSR